MSKGKGKEGQWSDAAAKLRGITARSRNRRYGVDIRTHAFEYRRGLQASLLRVRLLANATRIDQELARFDKLSAFEANRFAREPIGFDYLSFLTTPKSIPLAQEIRWLGRRLKRNSRAIKEFIRRKSLIEISVFFDRPQDALEEIEELELAEGVSLWSVTITTSILQWFYGTDAQKSFVTRIRQLNKTAMLPYVANYVSQLCEETVTLTWFRQSLKRRLTGREVTDITVYMESKLSAVWPVDDSGIATRLRIEQNHHDFDIYEALVGAFQALIGRSTLSDDLRSASAAACATLSDIPDIRLGKIACCLDGSKFPITRDVSYRSVDLLLQGKFRASRRAAADALNVVPNSLYDAIACAAANLPFSHGQRGIDSSLASAVIDGLRSVLARSEEGPLRHDRLEKICVMFSGIGYAAALQEFIGAERENEPDKYLSRLHSFATVTLSSSPLDAALAGHADLDAESPAVAAINAMRIANLDIATRVSPEVNTLVRSFRFAISGDGERSAEALSLLNSSHQWLRSHASLILLRGCGLRGDLDAACRIVSSEVCLHRTAPNFLPIDEIFSGLDWKVLEKDAHTLHFQNAFHIYAEQSGDDKAPSYKRFALMQFLKSMGISLPSHLRPYADKFNSAELKFFWGKVCAPQSIDMLRGVRGSARVLEERRAICSAIIGISRDGTSEYEEEIVAITKELTVQQGLRVYDGSRVHVDRPGLKKVLRKRLSESYARYTALVRSGIGVGEDFDELLRDLIRNEGGSKYLLAVPENEADELLHSIMGEIREAFLLNIPHGLDSYLSKRVRHGSVVGHIRGAVEQEEVILQRSASQRYEPNPKLTVGLPFLEAEEINSALVSFSKAFDLYLLRLKDVVLHVKTADHPLGIFDLSYNVAAVHLIRSSYKADTTFNGLLESVLTVFWSLITPSLTQARHILRVEASGVLSEQLRVLRQRVQETVTDSAERARIGAAISRAITGVQTKLETAASWFDSAQFEPREYTIEEAVSVGVASVQAIHYGFDPKVSITTEHSSSISVTYLPVFVDVLFVIFGNIAENSNCGVAPNCSVLVSQDVPNGVFKIRVENQVSISEPFGDCVARIARFRDRIAAGELADRVREEGDSGFAKLSSIVAQSSRGSLNFGYRDEHIFFVEVELSLVVDEESTDSIEGF